MDQEIREPDRTIAQELPLREEVHVAQPNSEEGVHVLSLDEKEIAFFNELRDKATKLTVLGRLSTASPGYSILKDWARSTLHSSFEECALIGGGFFEARFTAEGVLSTLSNVYFNGGKEVLFTPWNPHFNADNAETFSTLQYRVWIQFLGLGMHLRNETCLKILASKLGRVLFVDNASNHAGKTAGSRVKVLVEDYTKIPDKIRIGPDGSTDHKILVTGQPSICLRCKEPGHSAKSCFKKMDQETWRAINRPPQNQKRPQERKWPHTLWETPNRPNRAPARPMWREKPKDIQRGSNEATRGESERNIGEENPKDKERGE